MSLRYGDSGSDVLELQQLLQKAGFSSIKADGFFGNTRTGEDETGDAVAMFQKEHGLKTDRIAGPITLSILRDVTGAAADELPVLVSDKAIALILEFEGCATRPEWPEGQSGITIGYGYDLGYEDTLAPWAGKISATSIGRLAATMGVTGSRAHAMLVHVRDVVIPKDAAAAVFHDYTMPAECQKAAKAFPGIGALHPDVQGAIVSLVYNRGTAMNGDRYREMREIRDCVSHGDVQGIADALRSMKRIWPGVLGLRRRRDAEADLVEGAIV